MNVLRLGFTEIVIAALFLASGCAGLAGASLPGKSTANPGLEQDTLSTMMLLDKFADSDCKKRKVVNREIVSASPKGAEEHWFVNRCGKLVRYRITYQPDPRGGTNIGWTTGEVIGKAE